MMGAELSLEYEWMGDGTRIWEQVAWIACGTLRVEDAGYRLYLYRCQKGCSMTGSGTVSAPHGSTSLPRSPRITAGVGGVSAEARRQAAGALCSHQPTSRFCRELASPQPSTTIRCQRRRLPREAILALTTLECPGPFDNCSVPACRGVLRMARREVRKIETIEREGSVGTHRIRRRLAVRLILRYRVSIASAASPASVHAPRSSPTREPRPCRPHSYSKPTRSQSERQLRGCTKHMPSQYKLECQNQMAHRDCNRSASSQHYRRHGRLATDTRRGCIRNSPVCARYASDERRFFIENADLAMRRGGTHTHPGAR